MIKKTSTQHDDEDYVSISQHVTNHEVLHDDMLDSMKLFIGQVPREMDEDALRPIFEGFGQILEITVIRDKISASHRGCAFLTYENRKSAELAIAQLHNKRKLRNATSPLQVKPAAEGKFIEKEHKLFGACLCFFIKPTTANILYKQ